MRVDGLLLEMNFTVNKIYLIPSLA